MNKTWRKIPGFLDYSVSSYGQIRRDTSKKGARAGRILSQWKHGRYRVVVLRDAFSNKKNIYVHRAVALAFLGCPPSPKHEVAHWNNLGCDNHVTNLRWATRSENHADKHRHGTSRNQAGVNNVNAKLTWDEVAEMRNKNSRGYTYKQLAKEFDIGESHVRKICIGVRWRPLEVEVPMPPKLFVG